MFGRSATAMLTQLPKEEREKAVEIQQSNASKSTASNTRTKWKQHVFGPIIRRVNYEPPKANRGREERSLEN
jgi:hypothetical protein